MGKMVDAQSITIATAATNQVGNEGMIFRFVMWHSVALGAIVGGGGGGRPEVALAGGKDPKQIDAALAEAQRLLSLSA